MTERPQNTNRPFKIEPGLSERYYATYQGVEPGVKPEKPKESLEEEVRKTLDSIIPAEGLGHMTDVNEQD